MAAVDYRIGILGGGIAVSLAIIIDLLQLGLDFVGIGFLTNPFLISPLAYLSFWTWFKLRGVKFFDPKNAISTAVGALLELLSAGLLPGLSLTVIRLIITTRVEDLAKSSGAAGQIAKKVAPKAEPARVEQPVRTGPPIKIGQPAMAPAPINLAANPPSPAGQPAKVIDMKTIRPPEPVNLAAQPDRYREAA